CGSDTAIGKAHELAGLPNQDSCTMLSLDRDRAVFIVADGVTTARIGSGDRASHIAVEVLADRLPDLLREAEAEWEVERALFRAPRGAAAGRLARPLWAALPRG